MKRFIFLISINFLTACRSHSNEQINHAIMQQPTIIDLVIEGDVNAVKAMLDAGANVNTPDDQQRNLLLIATINRHGRMAELLVAYGADVNMQGDNLDSPFLYAGASGQTDLVKLFLANGARFDVFNRYNGSALIPACERGHMETVRVLVNTPAYPINHVNLLGWTALLEAIILGDGSEKYQQIVRLLKDGGADLNIADNEGVTPLQHAKRAGYKEIVRILEA